MYIIFSDFCDKCNPYRTEIADMCEICKNELGPDIIQQWCEVKEIRDCHFFPTLEQSREFLPGVDPILYQNLLKTRLKHNPDYYRIKDLTKLDEQNNMEEKKENYGFDALIQNDTRPRGITQPKLSFPLTEHRIPDQFLQKIEEGTTNEDNDSGSDKND